MLWRDVWPMNRRQCDGDVVACEASQQGCGHLRRVGERLIIDARQRRNEVDGILCVHIELGVIRTEMFGDGTRLRSLVEARITEADGEGPNSATGALLHQCDDRG